MLKVDQTAPAKVLNETADRQIRNKMSYIDLLKNNTNCFKF